MFVSGFDARRMMFSALRAAGDCKIIVKRNSGILFDFLKAISNKLLLALYMAHPHVQKSGAGR